MPGQVRGIEEEQNPRTPCAIPGTGSVAAENVGSVADEGGAVGQVGKLPRENGLNRLFVEGAVQLESARKGNVHSKAAF